jgi:PST family polysaccharide transporter
MASVLLSTLTALAMAVLGCGYWSLVGMTLVLPGATTLGVWLASRWVPGRPRRGVGIGSIVRMGGALTLNGIIIYVAYNADKILLGRFWGAAALGNYGRAYQLVSIPTDNLNNAVGGVALSALSRVRDKPEALRAYFLKGYSLVVALTVPCTVACAVFAPEIVAVVLGPKWSEAAVIARLLAPTILVFGLINPMFWLVFSLGLMRRSLWIAIVIAVLVLSAYAIGLPYGPRGVAAAYSTAMTLWLVPHLIWCLHGTVVRPMDLARAAGKPLAAGLTAALVCVASQLSVADTLSIVPRLAVGLAVLGVTYLGMLLIVLRQLAFYNDLFKTLLLRRSSPAPS